MNVLGLEHAGPLAVNLNQPGSFLHWSIFTVSVANLVLIAVMVVIFGAALLLPFPRGVRAGPAAPIRRRSSRKADDRRHLFWTS
jgi:hypothetical protein